MTDRSVKKMEDAGAISEIAEFVEVVAHGDAFMAVVRDAEGSVRARGFGPDPDAALQDLQLTLQ